MKTATLALLVLAVIAQIGAPATYASGQPWTLPDSGSGDPSPSRESSAGLAAGAALLPAAANLYLEARKLEASDGAVSDQFGYAVGISGDTAIVGALADDDGGSASGSAYIFERDLGELDSWTEAAKLTASDGAANDQFGISVGISGDYAVVGAFYDNTGKGAAYVYARDQWGAGNWGQVKKLVASDAALNDRFGKAVAISGDTIIVGAQLEDDGCPSGSPQCAAGSAYIFQRDQGGKDSWGEVTKILPNDPSPGKTFGNAVAISGDYAAISAIGDSVKAVGAGAAYIFRRDPASGNWAQAKKLYAGDAGFKDKFGKSIGVSGNTVVVGAFSADIGGVNFVGAAYVFERDFPQDDSWGQSKKLTASDGSFNDQYAISAAINNDAIIIGAFAADDACPRDLFCDSGKAYLYGRNTGGAGNWGEIHPVVAGDTAYQEFFGISVAVTTGAAIVGAHHRQNAPKVKLPGAAYVFTTLRTKSLQFFKGDEPVPDVDGTEPPEGS